MQSIAVGIAMPLLSLGCCCKDISVIAVEMFLMGELFFDLKGETKICLVLVLQFCV